MPRRWGELLEPPILLRAVFLLLAALAVLASPGAASASLWIELSAPSGAPGTLVTGRTGGEGAFPGAIDPLPAYLIVASAADTVTEPDDNRLVTIGELTVDASGNGSLEFRVPSIQAGDYSLLVFCPSCAPTSAGRAMIWTADFEITAALPATDTAAATTAPTWSLALLLLSIASGGLAAGAVTINRPRPRFR